MPTALGNQPKKKNYHDNMDWGCEETVGYVNCTDKTRDIHDYPDGRWLLVAGLKYLRTNLKSDTAGDWIKMQIKFLILKVSYRISMTLIGKEWNPKTELNIFG